MKLISKRLSKNRKSYRAAYRFRDGAIGKFSFELHENWHSQANTHRMSVNGRSVYAVTHDRWEKHFDALRRKERQAEKYLLRRYNLAYYLELKKAHKEAGACF